MLGRALRQQPPSASIPDIPLFFLRAHDDCALREAIEELGAPLAFDRNQEIYYEREPALYLYRIVSGVVRTCRFLADGRRQIGSFHFAGDMLGLDAGATHALTAEAVEPCELVVVKRAALAATAAHDAALACALWQAVTCELQRAREHVVLLGRRNAPERLIAFLRDLSRTSRGRGRGVIEIPMSRQDIADYLGLTVETVSRTISQLEETGIIMLESSRRMRICDAPGS